MSLDNETPISGYFRNETKPVYTVQGSNNSNDGIAEQDIINKLNELETSVNELRVLINNVTKQKFKGL